MEIIINKNPLFEQRTKNISTARNKLIEYINNFNEHINYVIMMDLDDVCSNPMDIGVLKNVLHDTQKWDGVSFFGEPYYDFWVLSIGDFQYSCWHWDDPRKMINIMKEYLYQQKKIIHGDYIECDSAFNGFAIYKWEKFKNCVYKGNFHDEKQFDRNKMDIITNKFKLTPIITPPIFDCEHRFFHLSAKQKNNAKICIYKKNLFPPYPGVM